MCVQMQRSRSGDRQPPQRGGAPDLGKEIMKAEHYPTLGKCMEIMREGLRIMISSENRASGVRSTVLPSYEVESSPKCPASPEFDTLRDLRNCRLFEADLKRPANVRTLQMQALARLLNVDVEFTMRHAWAKKWFRNRWRAIMEDSYWQSRDTFVQFFDLHDGFSSGSWFE